MVYVFIFVLFFSDDHWNCWRDILQETSKYFGKIHGFLSIDFPFNESVETGIIWDLVWLGAVLKSTEILCPARIDHKLP